MSTRRYEMSSRNEARLRTREAILDAAEELFTPAYFDEVTLGDVAKRAGVSQQTVVNHFGGKDQLYLTGVRERWVPAVNAARAEAKPGDPASIVATACADYERTGDSTIRTLALAARFEELAELVEGGRTAHRAWVEKVFAPQLARRRGARRELLVSLLAIALDVRTWAQLRRERGLDERSTREHMRTLVEALI